MTWRATHQSPDRTLSRSDYEEWDDASRWLLTTMTAAATPGLKLAVRLLDALEPEEAFLVVIDGHRYELAHRRTRAAA